MESIWHFIGIVILLLLAVLICFTFISVFDGECTEHVDLNTDYICDECEAELEKPKAPCTECSDSDGDLTCDSCGKEIPKTESSLPPACEHEDENFDGKCDSCKADMENALMLIRGRKTPFSFVLGSGLDGNARLGIDSLAEELKRLGINVKTVSDTEAAPTEYEILFGNISGREENYTLNPYSYGINGYAVRIIGNKIAVVGGSSESLYKAINLLRTEFFGIDETTARLTDRCVYPEQNISVIQNDYKVNKITLCGEDISGYTIAVDKKDSAASSAAISIRELFYEKCGYWLPIVDVSEAGKSIIFSVVEYAGEGGFSAMFSEGKITFLSEYSTSIKREPYSYFSKTIEDGSGTLAFTAENSFVKNVHEVSYKDFGAVGDGVTNDAEAILEAHKYAYEGGHKKIVAESGKTYYIGKLTSPAIITCNVDWTGAKFIIDDTVISLSQSSDIFSIEERVKSSLTLSPSNNETIKNINENGGIDASEITRLDLGLGYPAMIKVNNSSHKNYIRYGSNANSGEMQAELILIDAEGNIDPTTLFMFDYEKITSINVYRINAEPITVEGGEFTTIANNRKSSYYFSRGINIERSNVTVKGVEHYITGEGETGAPYSHFLKMIYSNNVLVEDCVFSAHKTYYNSEGTGIGTYDINVDKCINVIFKSCTQSNFFNEDGSLVYGKWGVMASGQAKNITYDSCVLSRFDAHEGVWNVKIKNTTIKDIRVVGGGILEIEDCHIYKNLVISFREDFGAFWLGDVVIKDVTVHSNTAVTLMGGLWYNHDFGYKTAAPKSITVDGLKIEGNTNKVLLFSSAFVAGLNRSVQNEFTSTDGTTGEVTTKPNVNKTLPIEYITVKNNMDGLEFVYPEKTGFFENTVITEISR